MADGENDTDFSFIPDTFKGEDGAYDTAKFRSEFDALSAFKSQEDERLSGLPKDAKEYAWALPEGHAFPEGFDPEKMKTKDEAGNEVAFDPMSMLDAADPDIAAVQAALFDVKAPPALMAKLASIMVNPELRGTMEAEKFAGVEKAKLWNAVKAQARINTVTHALKARLPAEQASAVADSLVSADAVRGVEALLKATGSTTPPAPGVTDTSKMSADEKIAYGLRLREGKAA